MDDLDSFGLHAAVLAAGASTRFGSPKQLVRLGGSPVLHQAAATAASIAVVASWKSHAVAEVRIEKNTQLYYTIHTPY